MLTTATSGVHEKQIYLLESSLGSIPAPGRGGHLVNAFEGVPAYIKILAEHQYAYTILVAKFTIPGRNSSTSQAGSSSWPFEISTEICLGASWVLADTRSE